MPQYKPGTTPDRIPYSVPMPPRPNTGNAELDNYFRAMQEAIAATHRRLATRFEREANVVHLDESAEISGVTSATAAGSDFILIEDADDGYKKKRTTVSSVVGVTHTHNDLYYTETELNGGALDSLYVEVDGDTMSGDLVMGSANDIQLSGSGAISHASGGDLLYYDSLGPYLTFNSSTKSLFQADIVAYGADIDVYTGGGSVQHELKSAGDVDLCQQGGQLTVGGTGGAQLLTVIGGALGVDNGWAFRGKNAAGTYIDLLKVESGGYRPLLGASGGRTKFLANDSCLYPVPTSAVSDGNHDAGYMTFWVDETNHRLYFKVKYSGGSTVKSGYISIS